MPTNDRHGSPIRVMMRAMLSLTAIPVCPCNFVRSLSRKIYQRDARRLASAYRELQLVAYAL